MPRQRTSADFRADFSKRLSDFMLEHSVSTVEMSKWSGVNRETIADAADNRRHVRTETIERLSSAMQEIRLRREAASSNSPGTHRGNALVIAKSQPDYQPVLAATRAGMVVLVGDEVEVWELRRVK
jgi:hypothetical protein